MMIDNTYDFRKDVKPNADPDKDSKKLRSYHKELWSKNLPSGGEFNLSDTEPNKYLFHKSSLGEFSLSSDGIGVTFRGHKKRMHHIINQINDEKKYIKIKEDYFFRDLESIKYLFDSWYDVLKEDKGTVYQKGVFYMCMYFIRFVPFRMAVSREQGIFALIMAIAWLHKLLEE